jgi:hypothetical protein
MDKNAIKKYAVWARRELISRVSQKAYQYGIRGNDIVDASADSIDGRILNNSEKKERRALIAQVTEKGFEQVMEKLPTHGSTVSLHCASWRPTGTFLPTCVYLRMRETTSNRKSSPKLST